ncbi:MAG: hypothetical protein GTO18_12410 [Anaerolineales bacterium]|nr:hypothetical protein [Anaerolineales bacterium]
MAFEEIEVKKYEKRVTPFERLFSHSPYAIVTMVARIKGDVTEGMLTNAVSKVEQRHPNLRVRIKQDEDHIPWFTSDGVNDIPVKIVARKSDDHWIQVVHEEYEIPFEFDKDPAIRFILVQSPTISELIILCHHIICDGLSLAYLVRDLMLHLADPTRGVEVLPDPVPIDEDNLPDDVSLNSIVKFLVNRINKKWKQDEIFFDQEDYRNLSEAYWMNFTHRMFSVELSEAQTSALVARCREEEVTVNTAITTAFVGAQTIVQGEKPYHSSIGVAVSLRDRLPRPAGEVIGFYAGFVMPKYKYDSKSTFWENARRFHRKINPLYTNQNLFQNAILCNYREPAIIESSDFKLLGGLVPPHFSRYQKISEFSKRDDVVLSLLKRRNMDSLDEIYMGTAVTNLTRLDFPREYGTLELDRLIMNPGSSAPLAKVNLVVGAVTCAGKLSLVLEYAEETIDTGTMERVKEKAMEFLLGE